nr:MAG TPA: hypothetical protein [Caudoviricetes sp.]
MYRRGVCIYARGSNPPIHNRRNGENGASQYTCETITNRKVPRSAKQPPSGTTTQDDNETS